MATSQFTIYTSTDASGPGYLTGQAGSLLTILDACLVNGYTGKVAAGWTKPVANSGNCGCYKQGAGAGCAVHINDNGANVTSTFKEAWATGWTTITAVGTVGTGSGQFPTPAQLLTTGHVVIRKSTTADGIGRHWILFADAYTFYLFTLAGDSAGEYSPFYFGDIFSLAGSADTYRCIIGGQNTENNPTSGKSPVTTHCDFRAAGQAGIYLAGTVGAVVPNSVAAFQNGDIGKSNNFTGSQYRIDTLMSSPNFADMSLYVCPLSIIEQSGSIYRGRLRGIYQPISGVMINGGTIAGTGDYAGKTFYYVNYMLASGGQVSYMVVEISNTVETN